MSTPSPKLPGSSSLYGGAVLAITSLLTILGGVVIWSHREPASSGTAEVRPPEEIDARPSRALPPPPVLVDPKLANLHTIAYAVENGTVVVKIKVVPDGDELIVDASTGRLLETRPSRPTGPPPIGKFAAPFEPMM